MSRVHHILDMNGVQLSETDKLEDADLVMEVMEAREALEEATSEGEAELIRQANGGSSPFRTFEAKLLMSSYRESC